jgi:hypothetical protein
MTYAIIALALAGLALFLFDNRARRAEIRLDAELKRWGVEEPECERCASPDWCAEHDYPEIFDSRLVER